MSREERPPEEPLDDERQRGFVPDFVRKMAAAGLGAVFMSEEGIRRLAGQLKLPKEGLHLLLSQADRTKDEVARVVADEVRKLLQSERLRDEMLKMIAGMTIEIRAEVKLVPDRVKGQSPSLLPKLTVSGLEARYERPERKRKRDPERDPE